MKKSKSMASKLAMVCANLLGMALIVCANTASSGLVHQHKAPEALNKFSKVK